MFLMENCENGKCIRKWYTSWNGAGGGGGVATTMTSWILALPVHSQPFAE